jgi:hypothetical protein
LNININATATRATRVVTCLLTNSPINFLFAV